ncbi:MAG TPA: hypothetical protein DCQ51_03990, partial [Planktothrix sp. UBA8407]|nr:hypothetical protein [Planktothrix sp. UBA8407]HBK23606.1 hypothetical protein [Planktothrix sp. UBA10369]
GGLGGVKSDKTLTHKGTNATQANPQSPQGSAASPIKTPAIPVNNKPGISSRLFTKNHQILD